MSNNMFYSLVSIVALFVLGSLSLVHRQHSTNLRLMNQYEQNAIYIDKDFERHSVNNHRIFKTDSLDSDSYLIVKISDKDEILVSCDFGDTNELYTEKDGSKNLRYRANIYIPTNLPEYLKEDIWSIFFDCLEIDDDSDKSLLNIVGVDAGTIDDTIFLYPGKRVHCAYSAGRVNIQQAHEARRLFFLRFSERTQGAFDKEKKSHAY